MLFQHDQFNRLLLLLSLNVGHALGALNCLDLNSKHEDKLHFKLIKRCQRSKLTVIELENTQNLSECIALAKSVKGLALNYGSILKRIPQPQQQNYEHLKEVSRFNITSPKHFWQQPEEYFNCHIFQCPENSTYKTMVNDGRYDYFSLYERAPDMKHYYCLPEVGLFQINPVPQNYIKAAKNCSKVGSFLAHVASAKRTDGLAGLLIDYNTNKRRRIQHPASESSNIYLAYVGLNLNHSSQNLISNDFLTAEKESLKCFLYRAWAPGHPRSDGIFSNTSCVALSTSRMWITVDCDQQLPSICETYTSKISIDEFREDLLPRIDSTEYNISCPVT